MDKERHEWGRKGERERVEGRSKRKKRKKDRDRKEDFLLEGSRHEVKEVVHTGTQGKGDIKGLNVMYTNVDGLMSSLLEVKD